MIKLIIVAGLALLQATITTGQATPKPPKAEIKTAPVVQIPISRNPVGTKTAPATTIPPASTARVLTSSDYYLTSAKLTLNTGNDNKEKPSGTRMYLSFEKEPLFDYVVPQWEYKEYPVNSSIEFVMRNVYGTRQLYEQYKLSYAEANGVKLMIDYRANFPLDAWKIEKAVITLEFRDGNGNLHPTLGTKTIVFTNIGALLNYEYPNIDFIVDKFLMPREANVIKRH